MVLTTPPGDLRAPGLAQQVHAPKEHGAFGEEVDGCLNDFDADVSQDTIGGTALFQGRLQVSTLQRQHAFVDSEEQVVLGLKVVVHRAFSHTCSRDDLQDTCVGKPWVAKSSTATRVTRSATFEFFMVSSLTPRVDACTAVDLYRLSGDPGGVLG